VSAYQSRGQHADSIIVFRLVQCGGGATGTDYTEQFTSVVVDFHFLFR
jgi:hypothetical protein